jgi:hypothetical protein
MRFLTREIKQDKKGLYVHYGSYRLRPNQPRKTRFNLDDKIEMIVYPFCESYGKAMIFDNIDYYEIWKSRER